jgi:starch synthase (maltosyl-transferring)
MQQRTAHALDLVERALRVQRKKQGKRRIRYFVPTLWGGPRGAASAVKVDPFSYYLGVVRKIKRGRTIRLTGRGGEWSQKAVIYNMFVRTTTAFDHNRDGKLDLDAPLFRETGTFLKAMAMLPYIKRLGANTVHLLPITSIGQDGNKGTLGSPYAIRNAYELDERLSEPALGLDVKTEFKAFVEAAHRLGLRVVVEFVFRTAAKDADWVKEHPEWFYWIKEDVPLRDPSHQDEQSYGSPLFTRDELDRIHADVRDGRMDSLTPPHQVYRDFFTLPPSPERVTKEKGRYIGTLADGTRVKIPGAFADWPPDDNQPPWGDVTYLRMYTHPDFNYIGYNTIRMYDTRLTQDQFVNRQLWDKIVGIVPYYQKEFHIDGVMIDMGHALPMKLKAEMVGTARKHNPDFAFWDENFAVTRKSREEGYNAVFGFCWVDQAHADRMKNLCWRHASEGFPIPYFSTPENHNTPRAAARPGGLPYARWTIVVNSFLPAIPFIHSGFELAERFPINTGLDFTNEDLKKLPSERLPLFSAYAYNWVSKEQFTPWVAGVIALRKRYAELVADPSSGSFRMLEEGNGNILAFARVGPSERKRVAVIGNMNFAGTETTATALPTEQKSLRDLLGKRRLHLDNGVLRIPLGPGECVVAEY